MFGKEFGVQSFTSEKSFQSQEFIVAYMPKLLAY
jgi:hypothetical protein